MKKNNGKLVSIIGGISIFLAFVLLFGGVVRYPEQYLTTVKGQFREKLNQGDEFALTRYKEVYIEKDEYLFNGPLTIKLMAEKYDLDFNTLWEEYENSGCKTAMQFYRQFVR